MTDPYRNDDEAQEFVREHLERENEALMLENEELRERVRELEGDGQRLTIIARGLIQPSDVVQIRQQVRDVQVAHLEMRRAIRHMVVTAACAFLMYELLLRAL